MCNLIKLQTFLSPRTEIIIVLFIFYLVSSEPFLLSSVA